MPSFSWNQFRIGNYVGYIVNRNSCVVHEESMCVRHMFMIHISCVFVRGVESKGRESFLSLRIISFHV